MYKKYVSFICIIIFFSVSVYADPPTWQPIQGTQYSMVVMAEIYLFNDLFNGQGSNMAAAFGPGGELDCRSLGAWQPSNPPYWDGYWYFTVVGNINGEVITFKIYDESSDSIYVCSQEILFENNHTIGSPQDPYNLSAEMGIIQGIVTLLTLTPPAGNVENTEIIIGDTSVFPDDSGFYQLPVSPGSYDVSAQLVGYTDVNLDEIEVIGDQTTDNVDFTLIDWQQISGTQFSMVIMAEVYLGRNYLTGNSNNQIAVFGPGGYDDCRAVGVWEEPNLPYWDGYWYINAVGNSNGEQLHFEIFNEQSSEIQECTETVIFQNDTTIGSPEDPYTLSIGSEQLFQLGTGWNWISLNIHPENSEIDSVFYQLGSFIYQIKNQTQSATYYDPPGSWVGNLTDIIDGSAYLVNMHQAVDSFVVHGVPIDAITPIQLSENWNWIAYYPHVAQSLTEALSSIEGKAYQIKNQSESATYYDPPGVWVGNLETMTPNIGYKLKANESCELIYPDISEKKAPNTGKTRPNPPDWQIIPGTQYSMILMAQITYNGQIFEGGANLNMAGAFGPGGVDDCRSVAAWQESFPPYWDGYWYFTIVGNDNGENITFKIYNSETDSIYNCVESIIFQDNTTIGEPSSPYQLTAVPICINHHYSGELDIFCYPNPYSKNLYFNLSSFEYNTFNLLIFDLKGRLIKSFNQGDLSKNQIIKWNSTDHHGDTIKSGIYLYQIKANKNTKNGKFVFLSK